MLRPGLAPRDVGRNALPAPVAPLPIIGVTAAALSPVGLLVAGGGVDDGEVAENPDHDVVLAQIFDRSTPPDLGQEGLAVEEAAVGIGIAEIRRQVGVKPGDIGFGHRPDIVAIELTQPRVLLLAVGHASCLHCLLLVRDYRSSVRTIAWARPRGSPKAPAPGGGTAGVRHAGALRRV